MPTYEYLCDACEHQFELFQSITAEPVKVCPECGKRKVRRLISPGAGILFRGSGFYQTDYRSESYKKAAAAEKGSDGASRSNGQDGKNGNGKARSKATAKKEA